MPKVCRVATHVFARQREVAAAGSDAPCPDQFRRSQLICPWESCKLMGALACPPNRGQGALITQAGRFGPTDSTRLLRIPIVGYRFQ